MRKLHTVMTLCAMLLCGFATFTAVGCSDATQLDNAQEDLNEEQAETAHAAHDAAEDGMVTGEDLEEVSDEMEETGDAAAEVTEQKKDLQN